MKKLIIKQLTILSKDKNEGNQFTFTNGVNFILSKNNSAGKTTLLNLIYSVLGCMVKFKEEWINSFIKLDVSIEDKSYTFYKTPNGIYYIKDDNSITEYTNNSEYQTRIATILGYRIYLKDRSGTPKIARPAYFFLTSYISQVKGWTSFFPQSFSNLGEFQRFQVDLVEQFCKVKSNQELDNEEEVKEITKHLTNKFNEKGVLLSTRESLELNIGSNLKELESLVETHENNLNLLQEELSDLIVERQFLRNELAFSESTAKEFDADYQEARKNTSKIECPYCGTIHSNTITEKSELFFLKTKLEDNVVNQKNQIQKINNRIHEIEKEISNITGLRHEISSAINENTKKFIKNMAINGISEILVNIEQDILDLEERKNSIIGIKRKNAKKYKQHKSSVNDFFVSKLKQYADKLSITFNSYDNIKKVRDYNKILNAVKGGAADSNRAILAYYLAIYNTAIKYDTEILPPLVLDTPNQNDQDKYNYDSIINTLIGEKEKQIIICLIDNTQVSSMADVNKIYVNRLMKKQDDLVNHFRLIIQ